MSKMKMAGKPPLPRSPIRLRPRRALAKNSSVLQSVQTPPGSLTKSQKLTRSWDIQESELRPEYRSISCELRSLAGIVSSELRDPNPLPSVLAGFDSASVFERGRFYDEYSARRNERLRRKKNEEAGEAKKTVYLGVAVESSKRRDTKKLESLRKSVAVAYSAERINETPRRYVLRSSAKENKKPPLSVASSSVKSVVGTEKRIGTAVRRTRKI